MRQTRQDQKLSKLSSPLARIREGASLISRLVDPVSRTLPLIFFKPCCGRIQADKALSQDAGNKMAILSVTALGPSIEKDPTKAAALAHPVKRLRRQAPRRRPT